MSPAPRVSEPPFQPFNRKYLGSKRLLGGRICDIVIEQAGVPASFLDGFCGTGAVGLEMAARGAGRVVAVDSLVSNCIILRAFSQARRGFPELSRMGELMEELNRLPPCEGYLSASYGGTYFTAENCMRMEAIREWIAAAGRKEEISAAAHDYLVASFLLAADRVANTLGQYDAFLKNIDVRVERRGRHLVDERVHSAFRLRPLAPPATGVIEVINADILAAASSITVAVSYFDPPYNSRQYCDNYHVLENLAKWEKPLLSGKTQKFNRSAMRSPFSRRGEAAGALHELLGRDTSPHVFLSYNSEGILSHEAVLEILSGFGAPRFFELPYPVFGNGAGVSRRRTILERLYYLWRSAEVPHAG